MMKKVMMTIGLGGTLVAGVTPAFAEEAAPAAETSFVENTKAITKAKQKVQQDKQALAEAQKAYDQESADYKQAKAEQAKIEATIEGYEKLLEPSNMTVIERMHVARTYASGQADFLSDLAKVSKAKEKKEAELNEASKRVALESGARQKAKTQYDEMTERLKQSEASYKKLKTAREKLEPKQFLLPTTGRISQNWGQASGQFGYTFHNGVDVAANVGTPIYAAEDGKVLSVESYGAYGKHVMIEHQVNGQKWTTVYAHMNDIDVKVGQQLLQGQHIGEVGNTGNSSGPHLHFEVHKGAYSYSSSGPTGTVDPLSVSQKVKLG